MIATVLPFSKVSFILILLKVSYIIKDRGVNPPYPHQFISGYNP
jgi:hypothetical protein